MPDIHIPPQLEQYVPLLKSILQAVGILLIGWIISNWIQRVCLRMLSVRHIDPALSRFLAGMARYTALAATVITTLETVGIKTTSLIAIIGSAGLAVGLALQGGLANFASGVLILFFRPFALGDQIKAAAQTGTVEEIGLFSTTLIGANNEQIIVPNGAIHSGSIINYSTRGTLGSAIKVSVANTVNLEETFAILASAAARTPGVLTAPPPAASLTAVASGWYDLTIAFSTRPLDQAGAIAEMHRILLKDLAERGIPLANVPTTMHPQLVIV